MFEDILKEKGLKTMPCGCLNHGVYLWAMPCPLWRESLDGCLEEWHNDIDGKFPENFLDHAYAKLGVTKNMYAEWLQRRRRII